MPGPTARPFSVKHDLAAVVGFAALMLVVCGPALLGHVALGPEAELDCDPLLRVEKEGPRLAWADSAPVVMDYARDLTFAHGLAAGRVDTWSPAYGTGAPMWAEQGGPFFPLKAIFYAAPSPMSYAWFLALRLLCAGLGAYTLARLRGLPPGAAFVAGALFELSGAMLTPLAFANCSSLCVIPWALAAAEVLARRRGAGTIALAGLALGIAGHGGHPSMIIQSFAAFMAAIAGHALVRRRDRRAALALCGRGALAVVLGVLLAAPALFPLVELQRAARSYKQTALGDTNWVDTLTKVRGLVPIALFASPLLDGLRHQNKWLFPFCFAPALGVVGLYLGVLGVTVGALDVALGLVLLLGVALTLAPPGLALLHHLPGLHYIMPTYSWTLVALPLTQAAGGAVAVIAERPRRALAVLVVTLAGGASVFLLTDHTIPRVPIAEYLHHALADHGGWARFLGPFIALAAVVAAVLALRRFRRAGLLLGALAVVELAVIALQYGREPTSRVLRAPPSPAVKWLLAQQARFGAVPFLTGQPLSGMPYGLDDVRMTAPLPLRRFVEYIDKITPPAFPLTQFGPETWRSLLVDEAAVQYIAVAPGSKEQEALLAADETLIDAYHDGRVTIYENPSAWARARIERDVVLAGDETDAQRRLVEAAQRGQLVLEGPAPATTGAVADDEVARIVDDSDPQRVTITAHLDAPGYLVLADAFYAGWEARVDGAAATIYPADVLFRAVPLPAGDHRVDFTYHPVGFRYGLAAFALGIAWLLGLAVRRCR